MLSERSHTRSSDYMVYMYTYMKALEICTVQLYYMYGSVQIQFTWYTVHQQRLLQRIGFRVRFRDGDLQIVVL